MTVEMTDAELKELENRYGVEISILKRLGMRWAVLVSLSHFLHTCPPPYDVPEFVDRELRLTRSMIESGCFTACDVECILTDIEREVIPKVLSLEQEQADGWMHLLGKAMRGELTPEEVAGLPFLEPVAHGCAFLGCVCGTQKKQGFT